MRAVLISALCLTACGAALASENVSPLTALRLKGQTHAVTGPVACGPAAQSTAMCPAHELVLGGGHEWVQNPGQAPISSQFTEAQQGWTTVNGTGVGVGSCQRAVAQCAIEAAVVALSPSPVRPEPQAYAYEIRKVIRPDTSALVTSGVMTLADHQPLPMTLMHEDHYGPFSVIMGLQGRLLATQDNGVAHLAYQFQIQPDTTVPARFAPSNATAFSPTVKGTLALNRGETRDIAVPNSPYVVSVKRWW